MQLEVIKFQKTKRNFGKIIREPANWIEYVFGPETDVGKNRVKEKSKNPKNSKMSQDAKF